MATAGDLLDNLRSLNLQELAIESLELYEEDIADQIAGQLSAGVNGDGSAITPEYSYVTKQLKAGKPGLSGVTDRVTLFDTGAHYAGLYADVKKTGVIETGSKDEKSFELQVKYGDLIYKPGETARQNVIDDGLEETWQKKIEDKTGLIFT